MNGLLKTTLAILTILTLAACDADQKSARLNGEESVQISAVSFEGFHWDEIIGADTAASVKNNNLIMMR